MAAGEHGDGTDDDGLPLYVAPDPHGLPAGTAAEPPASSPGSSAGITPAADGWVRRLSGFTIFQWVLPPRVAESLAFAGAGVIALGFVLARGPRGSAAPTAVGGFVVAVLAMSLVGLRLRRVPGGRSHLTSTQSYLTARSLRAWRRDVAWRLAILPIGTTVLCVVTSGGDVFLAALMLSAAGLSLALRVLPLAAWQRRRGVRLFQAYGRRSIWFIDVREVVTHPGHVLYDDGGLRVLAASPSGTSEPLSLFARIAIAEHEGRPGEALQLGTAAYRRPDPVLAYTLAGSASRSGTPELALEWLEQAVADGWWDVRRIRRDPGLAPLRADARFAALVEGTRANARHLGIRIPRR